MGAMILSSFTMSSMSYANDDIKPEITSTIVSHADSHITQYDGSVFNTYFYGDTSESTNVISGVAVIEPNNEIHPTHQHEGEEFLMILEGQGTWSLDGKESPAKQGDMLYVAAGVMHGIFNSGTKPLKFVVIRYKNK
ncbi:cupin domain-containing protein [Shewanella livingstonensis]|uniref:Cupin domain-containing protein n=2 Tax=Shewanella livingstonensis TaxID=150120 RepID=A0A3G8M2N0_9GAMM|nr:cupin domain-containing protein [Shewanella livingstonensis]